jgi:hypothetical protein
VPQGPTENLIPSITYTHPMHGSTAKPRFCPFHWVVRAIPALPSIRYLHQETEGEVHREGLFPIELRHSEPRRRSSSSEGYRVKVKAGVGSTGSTVCSIEFEGYPGNMWQMPDLP